MRLRNDTRHSPLFTLESGQSGLGFYTTQRDAAKKCKDSSDGWVAAGTKPATLDCSPEVQQPCAPID